MSDFAVLLVAYPVAFTVFLGLFCEDSVPLVYLFERIVQHFLLLFAKEPVLSRYLLLVPDFHFQNTGKQVGFVACMCCC